MPQTWGTTAESISDMIRLIIDSTPALIHTATPAGEIDFFNQTWLGYLGRPLEDLQGWKWTASIHPSDVEGIVERWCASLASGEPFIYEARVRRADGQYRWMLHHKVALRDEQGQIVKWYGSSIDIEDRKHAEEDLRKSEERWGAVFENSAVGIAITDVSDRFLATNASFQRMLGYDRGDLEGRSSLDMTHEEDRERNWMLVTELLEGKREQFQIEKRYWRRDGALIWVRNSVSLIPGSERTPQAIMRTVEDITDRKRAEEAVRTARARFEGILEIAQDAIISVDSSQRILLFNQGAEKVFGYVQAEVIGCPLDLLLPQRLQNVHRRHIAEFAQSPNVARTMGQRREVSGRRKDGSEFPAEASIS